MAAIASPEAAECYRLKVLLPNIQDRKQNYTRFIALRAAGKNTAEHVLSAGENKPDKAENSSHSAFKTSIIVYLEKDRPGALYEILGAFAK